MRSRQHQRGMALLIAIILVAIATTLAVAIGYGGVLFAKRSTSVFTWMQAERFAQGAEGLAAYALQQSLQGSAVVSPDEIWAQPYGPAELDTGVTLEASLEDLQGRFNINSLINAQGVVDPAAVHAVPGAADAARHGSEYRLAGRRLDRRRQRGHAARRRRGQRLSLAHARLPHGQYSDHQHLGAARAARP
jgi:type II secretory pathway component PulK